MSFRGSFVTKAYGQMKNSVVLREKPAAKTGIPGEEMAEESQGPAPARPYGADEEHDRQGKRF